MRPAEAATIIGCSPQQVRTLIRRGRMRARRIKSRDNQFGYTYDINKKEALRIRDQSCGWRRGKLGTWKAG